MMAEIPKKKKYINIKKIIKTTVFVTVLFLLTTTTVHAAWLTGWTNRKKVTITGQVGAGTSYQVQLKVGESSGSSGADFHTAENSTDFPAAKNDGGDFRFTDNDGSTLLDFWVESVSGTTPNRVATVWVEIADTLESNADIYAYYNKSGATNTSNGTNTFVVFDDFSGSSLDTTIWTQRNGGVTTFSGGIMSTVADSNYDPSKILATVGGSGPTGNNRAIRAKLRVTGGTNADERIGIGLKTKNQGGGSPISISDTTGPEGYNYVVHDFTDLDEINFLDDSTAWGTIQENSWAKNTWYTFEAFHDGTNIRARRDDLTWGTWARSGRTGYLSLNIGSVDANVDWDWAVVRKAIATEPSYSATASEETEDATNPAISILSPTDNATSVSLSSNLIITFDEIVNAGSGNITIYKTSDDSVVEVFDVTTDISGSGTTSITINPTSDFSYETSYYVKIDATAFDDVSGNSYAGISDTTTWNFTTLDTPACPTINNASTYNAYPTCGVATCNNGYILSNETCTASSGGIIQGTFDFPFAPTGGFKAVINDGTKTTNNRIVDLAFSVGSNVKKIMISNTGDFKDASQEDYHSNIKWDLCSKFGGAIVSPTCNEGKYSVYVKFYTRFGRSSKMVFDSVVYKKNSTKSLSKTLPENNNILKSPNTFFIFGRNLRLKDTGSDVKKLQKFLNQNGFILAQNDFGSPGKETEYFGSLTKRALIKFQEAHTSSILAPVGLNKGTGFFGPSTIKFVNLVITQKR